MTFNFDEIIQRKGTYSFKWDAGKELKELGLAANFDSETLPVFIADMDFACPPCIVSALHEAVDRRIYGYTSETSLPHYSNAVMNWFKGRFNWAFNKEDIVYVDGTVEALKFAIRAYSEKGDGVMITRPVYGPFTSVIKGEKRRVVNSNLINTDGYYTMDFDDIAKKASDSDVKMFILCSPHNPCGRVWQKEELLKLVQICEENNIILISDEVHCDLIRKGERHYPISTIAQNKENIVTLTAINKTFNTAGLMCTNAIIENENLRNKFKEATGHIMPSPFAIAALIAGYSEAEEWLSQLNEYIDANIDFALEFIKENMPKVKAWRPQGTYVLWMDMRAYNMSDEELFERIYNDANVILEQGTIFDEENGAGFQRICLSSPRAIIKQALERIAASLNR